MTDNGGIIEVTTVMGVFYLILRDNTECPETITQGDNKLLGASSKNLASYIEKFIMGYWKEGGEIPLWDG